MLFPFPSRRPQTVRRNPRRCRPRLEALEDRCLPSTVTNLLDSGPGSLRDAIASTPAGGTVDFQTGLSGTITLTSGQLVINHSLAIAGSGADVLSVSGNHASRVFDVAASANVALSALTISDGSVTGQGGGIDNAGTLALADCILSGNTANASASGYGGGINNVGTLNVSDSTLSGNLAAADQRPAYGGGIFSTGTLTLTDSFIVNNSTSGAFQQTDGGGIDNSGHMSLTGCVLSGNVAGSGTYAGNGGAIYDAVGANTLITGCTIRENSTGGGLGQGQGGGINDSGILTIIDSAISRNSARGAAGGFGGGIMNSGTLTLTGSSVCENAAISGSNSWAGGIDNFGTLTVNSCLFSENSVNAGGGMAVGGAILDGLVATITDSTFSSNSVSGAGALWRRYFHRGHPERHRLHLQRQLRGRGRGRLCSIPVHRDWLHRKRQCRDGSRRRFFRLVRADGAKHPDRRQCRTVRPGRVRPGHQPRP